MRDLDILLALDSPLPYTGRELRPHFIRTRFGIRGDAAVAFRGPCDVRGPDLVDLEDRERDLFIRSADMLHVLVEIFGARLQAMALIQRLMAALAADRVRCALPGDQAGLVRRQGDDVFVGEGKLTVSIATVSPVSALIHFGTNVDTAGTPVPTAGLQPLGLDTEDFARGLLEGLRQEIREVSAALAKVRPVFGNGTSA